MTVKRILILIGHPDASGDRLCRMLADAYARGASSAGHEIRRLDIARLEIPFLRSQSSFETGSPPPGLAAAQADIVWANHILLLFPLWLGDMPAMLKAFLEQVLRPGFAFAYRDGAFPEPRLAGRTASIVITMGMPALIYRWVFLAPVLRLLKRSILGFVGIETISDRLFGQVAGANENRRQTWSREMEAAGRKAR